LPFRAGALRRDRPVDPIDRGATMSTSEPGRDPLAPDDEDDLEQARGRGRGRWILVVVLVVALAIPFTGVFVDELDFGRSADRVREELGSGDPLLDAVLLVRTVRCDGQTSTGSAFALEVDGEVVLLTNRHVVDRASSIGVRSLAGGPRERVASYRVSQTRDVAVLTLADDSIQPAALTAAERVSNGAPIQIVGFPGGRPAAARGTVAQQVSERLVLDVSVQQGSSGSPVVDADGEVVGQVVARTEDGQGLALRISEVVEAVGSTVPAAGC
jgi:S1-C subfamily serine protease